MAKVLITLFAVCLVFAQGALELKLAYEAALVRLKAAGSYDFFDGAYDYTFLDDCAFNTMVPYPFPASAGVLQTVLSSGTVRVGVQLNSDLSPYIRTGATANDTHGYAVNFLQAVVNEWATAYSQSISIQYVGLSSSDQILEAVNSGAVDMTHPFFNLGAFFGSIPRREAFGYPCAAVARTTTCYTLNGGIDSYAVLKGMNGANISTSGFGGSQYLSGIFPQQNILLYASVDAAFQAVNDGNAVAVCGLSANASNNATFFNFKTGHVSVSGPLFKRDVDYVQGDVDLRRAFDASIVRLRNSGNYNYFDNAPFLSDVIDCTPLPSYFAFPSGTNGGALTNMLSSQTIRIGYNVGSALPPFTDFTTTPPTGDIVALLDDIVDQLNSAYSTDLTIEWVGFANSDDLFNGLNNGSIVMTHPYFSISSYWRASTLRRRTSFAPSCGTVATSLSCYTLSESEVNNAKALKALPKPSQIWTSNIGTVASLTAVLADQTLVYSGSNAAVAFDGLVNGTAVAVCGTNPPNGFNTSTVQRFSLEAVEPNVIFFRNDIQSSSTTGSVTTGSSASTTEASTSEPDSSGTPEQSAGPLAIIASVAVAAVVAVL